MLIQEQYEELSYSLYRLLKGIEEYQVEDYQVRIGNLKYNALVDKSDELVGNLIELEEKMEVLTS